MTKEGPRTRAFPSHEAPSAAPYPALDQEQVAPAGQAEKVAGDGTEAAILRAFAVAFTTCRLHPRLHTNRMVEAESSLIFWAGPLPV